jgi:CheY-like chemotaxis protein
MSAQIPFHLASCDPAIASPSIPPATSQTQSLKTGNYTVLLIDDDEDQLLLFQAILREEGFRVFSASSAEEAFDMMKRLHFDIFVTDLRMPGQDGLGFIKQIRALRVFPRNHHIPVIMLTACSKDIEDTAIGLGADVFLEKRHARTLLASQIRTLLSMQQSKS